MTNPAQSHAATVGRIGVVGVTATDVHVTASVAGIPAADVAAYTLTDLNGSLGYKLRAAIVTPALAARLGNGDTYAYSLLSQARRDMEKAGLPL